MNAVTNLAFLLAASLAFFQARKRGVFGVDTGGLIFLLALIGVGSGLFHTFAVRWAMLADVIPILLFQIAFMVVYARRVMEVGWVRTAGLLGLFALLIVGFRQIPESVMNGSLSYAPAFLMLSGLAVYHYKAGKSLRFALLWAVGLFAVSLTCRTLDMEVCPHWPLGTHFLWHLLNAGVLYACTSAVLFRAKL